MSFSIQVIVFVLGLCVGSFLNVLANRTLLEESLFLPPSHCSQCQKTLPFFDNIPVFSYVFLGGKCRFCRTAIHWQYPLVELFTAVSFLILVRTFGASLQAVAMAVFVSTLIAVTITDFKEKLIPHDITYPSILIGIAFSAFFRHDLLGSMAGIGASYIFFDFLAHYGLKLYKLCHGRQAGIGPEDQLPESQLPESQLKDGSISEEEDNQIEEMEVMGGGDAVLAALIAAWLGWQRLSVALGVGFSVGTLLGMVYLMKDMQRAGLLSQTVKPAFLGAIAGCLVTLFPFAWCGMAYGVSLGMNLVLILGGAGFLAGMLLGVVSVGTRVSKPFPFGPALALGGLVAIFWNPVAAFFNGGA